MSKGEFRKLKVLIAKQITDDERVILAGLDPTFTIENIDKGEFLLQTFKKKLAENASRFQSKKYSPDSRILTYLRIRAQEFNVQPPLFMRNKRQPEKGKGSNKRQRSGTQNNRALAHQTYVQQFVTDSTPQTEWGRQYDQVLHEEYQEGDNSASRAEHCDEFSESNKNQYMFDFCDVMDDNNAQAHEQIEQSLHMCAEIDEEQNNACSFESVEEDYDLYNMEESEEFNQ